MQIHHNGFLTDRQRESKHCNKIIQIEYCTNCETHCNQSKHSSQRYKIQYNQLKKRLEYRGIHVKTRQVPNNLYFPKIGSFEIYYNNKKIYSKLKNNKFPKVDIILAEMALEDKKNLEFKLIYQRLKKWLEKEQNQVPRNPSQSIQTPQKNAQKKQRNEKPKNKSKSPNRLKNDRSKQKKFDMYSPQKKKIKNIQQERYKKRINKKKKDLKQLKQRNQQGASSFQHGQSIHISRYNIQQTIQMMA